MNCKSCNHLIEPSDNFCSYCGGKVVIQRLSLKGTWSEFIGPFFSWDSNFIKTIARLFTDPKDVLNAYTQGAREKYFKPFSFLILYTSIALFYYKISSFSKRESFTNDFINGFTIGLGQKPSSPLLEQFAFLEGIETVFYNYYNLYIILTIPIFALFSYLTFRKYQNSYSEHLVFQAYIQSITGYMLLLFQIIFVNILGTNQSALSSIINLISIIYCNYVFISNYNLNFKSSVIANIKFFGLLTLFSVITLVIIVLYIVYLGLTLKS